MVTQTSSEYFRLPLNNYNSVETINTQYGEDKAHKMLDTYVSEIEFEKKHTIRGQCHDYRFTFCAIYALLALFGLSVIIAGIWALVRCMTFYVITIQESISVITISVLVIAIGVLMITVAIGCVLSVKYERASISGLHSLIVVMPVVLVNIFAVILVALGIAATGLIPNMKERILAGANSSLFTIHDSQTAEEAWNAVQNTLQCCGVVKFSDYEQVFDNFSVPLSCCNTTNPLANETTCPDIVMDTNTANITELIYTEGCVPQIVSTFHYIFSVLAGVSITVGILPICLTAIPFGLIWGSDHCRQPNSENSFIFKGTFTCFLMIIGIILAFGFAFISVAAWALTQDLSQYYLITVPANVNVMVLSVLLIVTGGAMIATCICQIGTAKAMDSTHDKHRFICECCFACLCILPMLILALVVGLVAAHMSDGLTSMELNSTLHKYLDDQSVQETWNTLQENMECCGVINFTDYETVFNNFSVPVSCCNTTMSPPASECSNIVRNSQQAINQTGLIYSQGCLSQLNLLFNNVFDHISTVTTIISGLQLAAACLWLSCISCATFATRVT